MYHPSKGLHVRCVTIGRQLDTATASVRLFTLHSSLFTHKKKPLCPPRYRWISPGTQKKEEQKALNPPHRDFSECKFITFSPNDKETKPEIAHYYIFTISPSSLSIFFIPHSSLIHFFHLILHFRRAPVSAALPADIS